MVVEVAENLTSDNDYLVKQQLCSDKAYYTLSLCICDIFFDRLPFVFFQHAEALMFATAWTD